MIYTKIEHIVESERNSQDDHDQNKTSNFKNYKNEEKLFLCFGS